MALMLTLRISSKLKDLFRHCPQNWIVGLSMSSLLQRTSSHCQRTTCLIQCRETRRSKGGLLHCTTTNATNVIVQPIKRHLLHSHLQLAWPMGQWRLSGSRNSWMYANLSPQNHIPSRRQDKAKNGGKVFQYSGDKLCSWNGRINEKFL